MARHKDTGKESHAYRPLEPGGSVPSRATWGNSRLGGRQRGEGQRGEGQREPQTLVWKGRGGAPKKLGTLGAGELGSFWCGLG